MALVKMHAERGVIKFLEKDERLTYVDDVGQVATTNGLPNVRSQVDKLVDKSFQLVHHTQLSESKLSKKLK